MGKIQLRMAEDDSTRYAHAAEHFEKALKMFEPGDEHYYDALWLSAKALAKSQRFDDAVERISLLLARAPGRYADAEVIGYEQLESRNWSVAVSFLEKRQIGGHCQSPLRTNAAQKYGLQPVVRAAPGVSTSLPRLGS